jgi:hypothetical protein
MSTISASMRSPSWDFNELRARAEGMHELQALTEKNSTPGRPAGTDTERPDRLVSVNGVTWGALLDVLSWGLVRGWLSPWARFRRAVADGERLGRADVRGCRALDL